MSLQEWIGSIISLLGLAAMFFFNQRKETGRERRSEKAPKPVENEEGNWEEFFKITEKHEIKKKKPLITPKVYNPHSPHGNTAKIRHPPRLIVEDDSDDLDSRRPVLRSPLVTRLQPIPPIHGEFVDRSPVVRKTIKELKSLRTMVICREIMERTKS